MKPFFCAETHPYLHRTGVALPACPCPRRVPPVAAFQPRVPYSDLVRMPAAEYRRRALAEMAQSRSFMVRGRGGRVEEVEEEEEEEEESGSERGSEAGSGYALDAERGA